MSEFEQFLRWLPGGSLLLLLFGWFIRLERERVRQDVRLDTIERSATKGRQEIRDDIAVLQEDVKLILKAMPR